MNPMRPLRNLCLCLSLASAQTLGPADASTASQKPPSPLFTQLPPGSYRACVTLYSASGSAGCSSPRAGSTAALLPVSSAAEVAQFGAAATPAHAVMAAAFFTNATLAALDATGNLAGVLLLPGATPPARFSPAASNSWNVNGEGLLPRSLSIPIFEVVSADVAADLAARAASNVAKLTGAGGALAYPRNVARLDTFMGPDGMDSVKCLAGGNCMPLGGMSAWASKGALEGGAGASLPIILATAAMDSTALFHDAARGADDSISGLVALLAAADALSGVAPGNLPTRRIVFAAFQGEAYGAIGSRKFVADVANFTCAAHLPATASPIGKRLCLSPLTVDAAFESLTLERIDQVVAVHGVGSRASTGDLTVHRAASNASAALAGLATAAGAALATGASGRLPPTPADTFVAALPSTAAAIVLTRYDASFEDAYYRSRFDGAENVNASRVAEAARVLTQTLCDAAGGASTGVCGSAVGNVSLALVSELLGCFLDGAAFNCALAAKYSGRSQAQLDAGELTAYTSVFVQPYISRIPPLSPSLAWLKWLPTWVDVPVAYIDVESYDTGDTLYVGSKSTEEFVKQFLAARTADQNASDPTCASCAAPRECIAGVCVLSTAHFHVAVSPSFTSTVFNRFVVAADADASDPLWTEPYWGGQWSALPGVLLYQVDAAWAEWLVLLLGLAVLVVSGVAVQCFLKPFLFNRGIITKPKED